MLEYSEYKSLVDILEQSNQDNAYQEVMKKEEKVLDTMNKVIKYYRDTDIKEKQFINMPLQVIVFRFLNVWLDIYNDILKYQPKQSFAKIFTKDDRPIYLGIMLILLAMFIYFVDATKSDNNISAIK